MGLYIVMLGPPGAGKGTQARILGEQFGLPVVSTGDMFRALKTQDTPFARKIQDIMARGELVPDDDTIQMVENRLSEDDCRNGAILDGFPRTDGQAEALEKLLTDKFNSRVAGVPFFALDKAEAVKRISGRRMCRANDHPYHVDFKPPAQDGICDQDGSELYQREDDKPEAVETRYTVYVRDTAPLVEYYRKKDRLFELDAAQPIPDVTHTLEKKFKEWQDADA